MRVIIIITLAVLLMGCTEINKAKARDIRKRTNQDEEWHALLVEEKELEILERRILGPTRIVAKENLIGVGVKAGIVLILVLTCSLSYYLIGFSIAKVKQVNLMLIPLDKHTWQYPLNIMRNLL